MTLYNNPYIPAPAIMLEIGRNGNSTRYPGDTFCSCCGSILEHNNSNAAFARNYGYVCWISDTKVEEQDFPEYFIEVLPLEDSTFLVIKGNTHTTDCDNEDDNDD